MYKLKLSRREKRELNLSKWLLVILAIVSVAAVVWLAWVRPAQKEANIDSFAKCQAAGNPIQETYPEVCLTKTGKRFVNPTQHKAHQDSLDGQDKLVPPTNPDDLVLDIDEWGVRVPLTTATFDLMYSYLHDGLNDHVTFSFKRLVSQGMCPGDAGVTLTRSVTERQPPYSPDNPAPAAHVGSYFFYVAYAGSPCYDTDKPDQVALVKQITGDKSLAQTIGGLLGNMQPIKK